MNVTLTHSFDLIVQRRNDVRYVDVKNSQTDFKKIRLTRNEVNHANVYPLANLVEVVR